MLNSHKCKHLRILFHLLLSMLDFQRIGKKIHQVSSASIFILLVFLIFTESLLHLLLFCSC